MRSTSILVVLISGIFTTFRRSRAFSSLSSHFHGNSRRSMRGTYLVFYSRISLKKKILKILANKSLARLMIFITLSFTFYRILGIFFSIFHIALKHTKCNLYFNILNNKMTDISLYHLLKIRML